MLIVILIILGDNIMKIMCSDITVPTQQHSLPPIEKDSYTMDSDNSESVLTSNTTSSKNTVKKLTKHQIADFVSHIIAILGVGLMLLAIILLASHTSWHIKGFIGTLFSALGVLLVSAILYAYASDHVKN